MRRALLVSLLAVFALSGEAFADVAILQYDRSATSSAELARDVHALGAETALFQKLPFVAVRGSATELQPRGAACAASSARHANERMEYHLHDSVPIAYGGAHPQPVWDLGYDGRGVNVAVIDSGADGLHPDLEQRVVKNYKVLHDVFTTGPGRSSSACRSARSRATPTRRAATAHTWRARWSATAPPRAATTPASLRARGSCPTGSARESPCSGRCVAMDHLLAHPELNVVAVNNSWGPTDDARASTPRIRATSRRRRSTTPASPSCSRPATAARTRRTRPASPTARPAGTAATCMINQLLGGAVDALDRQHAHGPGHAARRADAELHAPRAATRRRARSAT